MDPTEQTPEQFFAGHPGALAVCEAVLASCRSLGPVQVRVGKSQVALRRSRGFAYLWMPGQYLRDPGAEVVLTIALGRLVDSPRFKEVSHPATKHWMHHLEVHDPAEIDAEVTHWLREAADRAS